MKAAPTASYNNTPPRPPSPTQPHSAYDDLASSSPAAQPSFAPGSSSTSLDALLDSPDFVPLTHAATLLKTSTFSDLLTLCTDLHSSSLSLDSTMQTLVYENYSKFLSATDDVSQIGRSTGPALKSMSGLLTSIKSVGSSSASIESELSALRLSVKDKVLLLSGLRGLSDVLSLPDDIRSDVDKGLYCNAVDRWMRHKGALKEYGERFEALRTIGDKCEEFIEEVGERLKISFQSGEGR